MARLSLFAFLLLFTFSSYASDDDFLLLVPTIIASLNCDADEYDTCRYPGGCRRINGLWENGMCSAKTISRLNTELMGGQWYLVSSFSNGDFFNYIEFRKSSINPIPRSNDYSILGSSHSTDAFADPNANDAIVSYDSSNDDWFILDYWGRDIGTISSIEIDRVSDNLFTGCEYYLSYPDLTYLDGVCNPVRMSRDGFFKRNAKSNVLSERVYRASKSSLAPMKVPGSQFRSSSNQIIR